MLIVQSFSESYGKWFGSIFGFGINFGAHNESRGRVKHGTGDWLVQNTIHLRSLLEQKWIEKYDAYVGVSWNIIYYFFPFLRLISKDLKIALTILIFLPGNTFACTFVIYMLIDKNCQNICFSTKKKEKSENKYHFDV